MHIGSSILGFAESSVRFFNGSGKAGLPVSGFLSALLMLICLPMNSHATGLPDRAASVRNAPWTIVDQSSDGTSIGGMQSGGFGLGPVSVQADSLAVQQESVSFAQKNNSAPASSQHFEQVSVETGPSRFTESIILAQASPHTSGLGTGGSDSTETPAVPLPEIGIRYSRYSSLYSALEQLDDMIKQGSNLSIAVHSSMEVDSSVTLNFQIIETKSVLKVKSYATPKPSMFTAAPFDTTMQFAKLGLTQTGQWGTEKDAVSLDDSPATVIVVLRPGTGYEVDEDNSRLVFTVDNQEKTRIDVEVSEAAVNEGENARFTIGWKGVGRRPESDLTIKLLTTQLGNFAQSMPTSFKLTKSSNFRGVLEIPTVDDGTAEPNGRITVTVLPGEGYTNSFFNNTYSSRKLPYFFTFIINGAVNYVDVYDNDQPRITVSPLDYPVYEGDTAAFLIRSETGAPEKDLTVNISAIRTGDFFSEPAPTTFVLRAGMQSDRLEIPTTEDMVVEKDGSVRVEVKPGPNYVLAQHKYTGIEVWDDDVPRIEVESVNSTISEGGSVKFRIGTTTGALDADLTVNIALTLEGGNFLDRADLSNGRLNETFVLASGKESDTLLYSTVDDGISETDGQIGLEIRTGAGYRLGVRKFAAVEIIDDDFSIRVEAPKAEVYEGGTASFLIVTGDIPQIVDRTINVAVSQQGDYYGGKLPDTVMLKAGERTALLEFPTEYADESVSDGSITVRVLSGFGYTVSESDTATVAVRDQGSRPVPAVYIRAMAESIEEGEPVMFLLVTDVPRLAAPLTVHFEIELQGEFLDPVHTVPLPRTFDIRPGRSQFGWAAGIHGYSTENDERDEADGSITITLQSRAEYRLLDEGTATVQIRDNDADDAELPEISVAPATLGAITEGQVARFRLYSNSEVPNDTTVSLTVTDTGDVVDNVLEPNQGVILSGLRESVIEIPTANDGLKGDGGQLALTVNPGSGYGLGASTVATITVLDKGEHPADTPELKIWYVTDSGFCPLANGVSPPRPSELEEGDTAYFLLCSSITLERHAYVRMSFSGPEDMVVLSDFETYFIMEPGQKSRKFSIPTAEDTVHESDWEFTVTLESGRGYMVGNEDPLTVEVVDDDGEPVLSVFRESGMEIGEGQTALFRLNSPTAPLLDMPVTVSVTGASDFLANPQPVGNGGGNSMMPTEQSGNRTVVITGGSKEAFLAVETVADSMNEPDAVLTVALVDGPGYSVSTTASSSTLTVQDDDSADALLPEITIAADTAGGVVEGSPARFRLTSSLKLTDPLDVTVMVSQTGSFADGLPADRVWTIQSGLHRVFNVDTMPDETEESDGSITVTIAGGILYAVGEDFRASVEVTDDDVPAGAPEVTIGAVSTSGITEGGIAWFRLSAGQMLETDLNVSVAVSTTENFMTRLPKQRTIRIPAGRSDNAFGVEIIWDRVAGSDGTVTATVLDGENYTLGMADAATVSVTDKDEMPVFSIESVRDENRTSEDLPYVYEGETAKFRITTPVAPALPLELSVYVGGSTNFFKYGEGGRKVAFAAGHTMESMEVETASDDTEEYAGRIRATIMDSEKYDIGAKRSAFFEVRDSDSHPRLSIDAVDGLGESVSEITEGSQAMFKLTSTASLHVNLPVIVVIEVPSNFASAVSQTLERRIVVIPKGSKTATFSVDTVADSSPEPDGTITATILTSAGYSASTSVFSSRRVSVTVLDDDPDPGEPAISVKAVSVNGVDEGSRAYFRLITPKAPSVEITVNYEVGGTAKFISGTPGMRTEKLEAGKTGKLFHVETASNSEDDEGGGVVTVTIRDGMGYSIGEVIEAAVSIRDDDEPVNAPSLTLFAVSKKIYEGDSAEFRIFVTSQLDNDITVRLAVSGSSDYITGGTGIRAMTITSARTALFPFAVFRVGTIDNNIVDPDGYGSVTATLLSGVGYVTSPRGSISATTTVFDNEEPKDSPIITIEAVQNTTITEGTPAWFNVISSKAPATNLAVSLYVDVPAGLVPESIDPNWGFLVRRSWTVLIPAGQTQERFGYDTENDSMHEPGGSVTASIVYRNGYQVGNKNTAVVHVADDDPEPEISINPLSSGVKEGFSASFRLSSPTDTHGQMTINISISQTGDYLGEPVGFKTLNFETHYGSITGLTSEDPSFSLLTVDDEVSEEDGLITVTLLDGNGYTLGDRTTASTRVLDDDGQPRVFVERSSAYRISEGESAGFYVYSLPAPQSDLDVSLAFLYKGRFFSEVPDRSTVTIPAGSISGSISIPTFDDEVYEADGYVYAELLEGDYERGAGYRSIVHVQDDDPRPLEMPKFSVFTETGSIDEGGAVRFRIGSRFAPSSPVSVTVRISKTGSFAVDGEGDRILELEPGQAEEYWEVGTVENGHNELDGIITATVLPGDGYEIGSFPTAFAEVKDNDIPKISVSPHRDSAGGIAEADGVKAKFVIEWDIRPWKDLTINLRVDDGDRNFLLQPGPYDDTVILPTHDAYGRTTFEAAIENDSTGGRDGTITVTVREGNGYEPGMQNSAQVVVFEDDSPVLKIHDAESVVESETAAFTIEADTESVTSIEVHYTLENATPRNYLTSTLSRHSMLEFTQNPNSSAYESILHVELDDDKEYELTGMVKVTLADNPANNGLYRIATSDSESSALVKVFDNDAPELSFAFPPVEVLPLKVLETEGLARFTVTARAVPRNNPLEIRHRVISIAGDFLGENHNRILRTMVTFNANPDGSAKGGLDVKIKQNTFGERNGSISVELMNSFPELRYVAVDNRIARALIADDDGGLPVLSILDSLDTGEAGTAEFRVLSTTAPAEPLRVRLTYANTAGEYFGTLHGTTETRTLAFSPNENGEYEHILAVPLIDNATAGPPGRAKVTISKVPKERISSESTDSSADYSVEHPPGNTASVRILDNEAPTLRISDAPETTEGNPAVFVLAADTLPVVNPLTVLYQPANLNGDFLGEDHDRMLPQQVKFTESKPGGPASGQLRVSLHDDRMAEEDGVIEVELLADAADPPAYKIPKAGTKARVAITDTDIQYSITLSVEDSSVPEDIGSFNVKLTANPVPESGNSVLITTLTGTDTVLATAYFGGFSSNEVRIDDSANGTATVAVMVNNDGIYRGDGIISISLAGGEGYTVAPRSNPLTVTVREIKPEPRLPNILVLSEQHSITEGDTARFTIVANPAPSADISVRIKVVQEGDFIPFQVPNAIDIIRNTTRTDFTISTHTSDTKTEGSITVELLEDVRNAAERSYEVLNLPQRFSTVRIEKLNGDDVADFKYSTAGLVITKILTDDSLARENPQNALQPDTEALPAISIKSATDKLEEGEVAVFKITSDASAAKDIHINAILHQFGDFITGNLEHTIRLKQGQTLATLEIPTQNDDSAEADGSITATLHEGVGYSTTVQNSATVTVSDAMDRERQERIVKIRQQVMTAAENAVPVVLEAMSAQTVRSAFERMEIAFTGGQQNIHDDSIDSKFTKLLRSGGEALNEGGSSLLSILEDTSFSTELLPEEEATLPTTFWGLGSNREISGESSITGPESRFWNGEFLTAQFGADIRAGSNSMAGLAATVGESKAHFGSGGTILHSRFTSIQSHAGFKSGGDGFRLQTVAGYGTGENGFNLEQAEGISVESSHYTLAGRGQWNVLGNLGISENNPELAITGEAGTARQFLNEQGEYFGGHTIGTSHLRLAIDGSYRMQLDEESHFTSTGSFSLFNSHVVAGSNIGTELVAGLHFTHGMGFSSEGEVGIQSAMSDRSGNSLLHGRFDYDQGQDRLGLFWAGEVNLGSRILSGNERQWESSLFHGANENAHSNGMIVKTEVNYGIDTGHGGMLLTPFFGLERGSSDKSAIEKGVRISAKPDMVFELSSSNKSQSDGFNRHRMEINGKLSW